ncbi:MAG: matrixin family metalloprotease [Bdellovibrionales bacterium]|nr:matrixin family metalloprotease [Bdellovibrionales bacterium]
MKWIAFFILLLGTTFWLSSCSRKLSPEPSCNFVQSEELMRVSWKYKIPIHIYGHSSLPLDKYPQMESIIREAIDSWNQIFSKGRPLFQMESFRVDGSSVPSKDGYSMIYWLKDWDESRLNEQARTTIYWSGAQIFEADIRINAKENINKFYIGEDENFDGVDFKSLMIHELGHVLGLAHTDTLNSVMNVSLSDGLNRRQISSSDKDSLHCEY